MGNSMNWINNLILPVKEPRLSKPLFPNFLMPVEVATAPRKRKLPRTHEELLERLRNMDMTIGRL